MKCENISCNCRNKGGTTDYDPATIWTQEKNRKNMILSYNAYFRCGSTFYKNTTLQAQKYLYICNKRKAIQTVFLRATFSICDTFHYHVSQLQSQPPLASHVQPFVLGLCKPSSLSKAMASHRFKQVCSPIPLSFSFTCPLPPLIL